MYFKKKDFGSTIHFSIVEDVNESPVCVTEINVSYQRRPIKWMVDAVNAEPQKQFFYVSCFGTKREFWRRGYGRKMLQYIKDYYTGCVLLLEVGSYGEMTNEQLKAFYESEGFKEICPEGGYTMHYTMAIEL